MNGEKAFQATQVPGDFVELSQLGIGSIEHKLGYFGDARFVIFGYCAGGGEVFWKDGHGSGFGTGGWRLFLHEIAPLALRHGIHLGSIDSTGTHVLLIDRHQHLVYGAPRESAQRFFCQCYALPIPTRRCLCGIMDCAACASPTCDHANHKPAAL